MHVIRGGRSGGPLRSVGYALYVLLLMGTLYGFTIARFVFVISDPGWIARHLMTSAGGVVTGCVFVGVAVAVWRLARVRGPVTPPPPYIDHVLSTSIDRAIALRSWWRAAQLAFVGGGAVVAGLLGAALWSSGVSGPPTIAIAIAAGALGGALLAHGALCGQAGVVAPHRAGAALRLLRTVDLRAHGARGDRITGALLAGDGRAVVLGLSQAPERRRGGRLTPDPAARPGVAVARRDILGLRRNPGGLLLGLTALLIGAALLVWPITEPTAPPVLGGLGAVVIYVGTSTLSEGLRMSADHVGLPPLYGLSRRELAGMHAVTPAALTTTCVAFVVTAFTSTSAWGSAAETSTVLLRVALAVAAITVLTVVGASLLVVVSAYRTTDSMLAFTGPPGGALMLLSMALPHLVAFVLGVQGALTARGLSPAWLIAMTIAVGLWAAVSVRTATDR